LVPPELARAAPPVFSRAGLADAKASRAAASPRLVLVRSGSHMHCHLVEGPMHRLHFSSVAALAAALIAVAAWSMGGGASPARAAEEPDLIFRKSTVFHWVSPNDKLATYGLDDPAVEGVACHFTVPERGGFKGWLGLAEEVSDISLACRQVAPIRFKQKFEQGEDVFRQRRSLFFKKMQIVRGCDVKRNVLVYMVYSDRLIEGSPKNSTSTVPIMPWGSGEPPARCADWVEK
jgi:CreA protein